MKILIQCSEGAEELTAAEAQSFGGLRESIEEGCVLCSWNSAAEIVKYVYMTRFAESALVVLDTLDITEQLEQEVEQRKGTWDFSPWLQPGSSWTLKSSRSRQSEHDSKSIGNLVLEPLKAVLGTLFSYNRYETVVGVYATSRRLYLGVPVTDHPLGRREFRVFLGRDALKGPTAQTVLAVTHYSANKILLDPVCQSGTLIIEAALQSLRRSPRFFEKQKLKMAMPIIFAEHADVVFAQADQEAKSVEPQIFAFDESFPRLRSAQKNAQIADVQKSITWSRQQIDWFDLKVDEHSIDIVATCPDALVPRKEGLLFERVSAVLKKKSGVFAIVTRQPGRWIPSHGLEEKSRRVVYQGNEGWTILLFSLA